MSFFTVHSRHNLAIPELLTAARKAFSAEDRDTSGDLSMGSTGRSFQETYPLAAGPVEQHSPAAGNFNLQRLISTPFL